MTSLLRPFFLLLLMILISCGSEHGDWTEQVGQIARAEKRILCQIDSLHLLADAAWDRFNDSLSAAFDPSASEYTKNKMLEMRNGPLIRMFQAYDSLKGNIPTLLERTEREDVRLSEQMDSLASLGKVLETQKMELFVTLETKAPDLTDTLRRYYLGIIEQTCD